MLNELNTIINYYQDLINRKGIEYSDRSPLLERLKDDINSMLDYHKSDGDLYLDDRPKEDVVYWVVYDNEDRYDGKLMFKSDTGLKKYFKRGGDRVKSELLEKSAEVYSALIDHVNDMIAAAIITGGDPGGPYFSDDDSLKAYMEDYLNFVGLNEVYKVDYVRCFDDYPEMLQFRFAGE